VNYETNYKKLRKPDEIQDDLLLESFMQMSVYLRVHLNLIKSNVPLQLYGYLVLRNFVIVIPNNINLTLVLMHVKVSL
jgi:hypothetical protein